MRERRFIRGAKLGVRSGEKPGIAGYAAVFNEQYDSGWFVETIKPGAFKRALDEKQDVRCLFNHDPNNLLGRTKSNTLTMTEDSRGLHFDCSLNPDTRVATEVHSMVSRGDLDGCSFAFRVTKQTWRDVEDPQTKQMVYYRDIEEVELYDVGPVTYPAYESTSVGARSLFPDGIPAEVRAHVPGLREMKPGADMGDSPSDGGDGNADPDQDGDNDTDPALDTDGDGGMRMDASTMSDHFQQGAEHHDAMAASCRSMSEYCSKMSRDDSDDEMRELMQRMADMCDSQAELHSMRSEHLSDMQDLAYADYQDEDNDETEDPDTGRSRGKRSERRGKKLTKRVAGEDLPASAFAYVGDETKTGTWKLPIKFSSEEKTKRHIRNALARFNQTKGIPESEKPKVLAKIKAAAKKYGIGEQDSAQPTAEQLALTRARARTATLEAELTA